MATNRVQKTPCGVSPGFEKAEFDREHRSYANAFLVEASRLFALE